MADAPSSRAPKPQDNKAATRPLPEAATKEQSAPAPKAKTAPPAEGAAKHQTKVLVAEDNPVVRKGLNNFVSKWGFAPVEAENGDDAWQILENDPTIRLAILDWNLPGLTGMQICQRLRTKRPRPYVYALIFSARKSDEEQVLALEGGADDYLAKPAKPSLLRARLGVGVRLIELLGDNG
ncbi:MAG: response regulator [Thermodesulfobacteriota bacterium]